MDVAYDPMLGVDLRHGRLFPSGSRSHGSLGTVGVPRHRGENPGGLVYLLGEWVKYPEAYFIQGYGVFKGWVFEWISLIEVGIELQEFSAFLSHLQHWKQ